MQDVESSKALHGIDIPEGEMFKVDYSKRMSPGMNSYHYHNEVHEIILFLGGICRCCIDANMYELVRGSLAVMYKGINHYHKYNDIMEHEIYHIYLKDSYIKHFNAATGADLDTVLKNAAAVQFDEELLVYSGAVLSKIIKEDIPENNDIMSKWMKLVLLDNLFIHICRYMKQPEAILKAGDSHQTFLKIIKFIDDNYTDPSLSLTVIADNFSLSKHYLCRLFHSETGLTITDYLNRVRIQNACRKIKQYRKNIMELARAVGFSNQAYFNRIFKQQVDCTPREYLKKAALNEGDNLQ